MNKIDFKDMISFDDVKDRDLGKIGTPGRDAFEAEVRKPKRLPRKLKKARKARLRAISKGLNSKYNAVWAGLAYSDGSKMCYDGSGNWEDEFPWFN